MKTEGRRSSCASSRQKTRGPEKAPWVPGVSRASDRPGRRIETAEQRHPDLCPILPGTRRPALPASATPRGAGPRFAGCAAVRHRLTLSGDSGHRRTQAGACGCQSCIPRPKSAPARSFWKPGCAQSGNLRRSAPLTWRASRGDQSGASDHLPARGRIARSRVSPWRPERPRSWLSMRRAS